jgi:hypothetical protein
MSFTHDLYNLYDYTIAWLFCQIDYLILYNNNILFEVGIHNIANTQ